MWQIKRLILPTMILAVILVVSITLIIIFNRTERKNEQRIASDNQQEAALQEYIKEMSELLLHEKLRESQPSDEVRNIARVRTLTVLPRLDGERQRSILQFLYESGLLNRDAYIIDLDRADLTKVNLSKANMNQVEMAYISLTDSASYKAQSREIWKILRDHYRSAVHLSRHAMLVYGFTVTYLMYFLYSCGRNRLLDLNAQL